jgi:hypothetical protein
VSTLDDHLRWIPREGFMPSPAIRRLIAAVQRGASLPANKGETGAWMFTFARLSTMSEEELKARGCPANQVEPLLRFVTTAAVHIVSPIVPASGEMDPETLQETSGFIARIASLKWGTEDANRAHIGWLISGTGHLSARVRRDPEARQLLGFREERHQ